MTPPSKRSTSELDAAVQEAHDQAMSALAAESVEAINYHEREFDKALTELVQMAEGWVLHDTKAYHQASIRASRRAAIARARAKEAEEGFHARLLAAYEKEGIADAFAFCAGAVEAMEAKVEDMEALAEEMQKHNNALNLAAGYYLRHLKEIMGHCSDDNADLAQIKIRVHAEEAIRAADAALEAATCTCEYPSGRTSPTCLIHGETP